MSSYSAALVTSVLSKDSNCFCWSAWTVPSRRIISVDITSIPSSLTSCWCCVCGEVAALWLAMLAAVNRAHCSCLVTGCWGCVLFHFILFLYLRNRSRCIFKDSPKLPGARRASVSHPENSEGQVGAVPLSSPVECSWNVQGTEVAALRYSGK